MDCHVESFQAPTGALYGLCSTRDHRYRQSLAHRKVSVVFNSHSNWLFTILASGYINFHAYATIRTSKDDRNVSTAATDSGCPTKRPLPHHTTRGLRIVMRRSEHSSPNAPMSSHSFFVASPRHLEARQPFSHNGAYLACGLRTPNHKNS